MKGKDELEGTWSNFTPWQRDFEHQGENCLEGLLQYPLRTTRVKGAELKIKVCSVINK